MSRPAAASEMCIRDRRQILALGHILTLVLLFELIGDLAVCFGDAARFLCGKKMCIRDRYTTRVQGLVEAMEANKKD